MSEAQKEKDQRKRRIRKKQKNEGMSKENRRE